MKWRLVVPFLRAFWHRPADYLSCGTPRSAVSLFPLPWMIPDRSSPSRVRFADSTRARWLSAISEFTVTRPFSSS